jgi:integrase
LRGAGQRAPEPRRASPTTLNLLVVGSIPTRPTNSLVRVGDIPEPEGSGSRPRSKPPSGRVTSRTPQRSAPASETFARGKPPKDKKTREIIPPKEYRRSDATVSRYVATLSRLFAVKERRLIDRNPVGDIRRKKEPRGRTRFLSDEERAALLHACANSEWAPLHALVLLAITTGARRGELVSLKWADVDFKAGRATIHDTKNGEQRTLPLAGKALEALRQIKLQNSPRSDYLFSSPTVVLDPKTGKAQLDSPYEHFDAHWHAALDAAGSVTFASMTCAIPRLRCSPRRGHRFSRSQTCSDTRRWRW